LTRQNFLKKIGRGDVIPTGIIFALQKYWLQRACGGCPTVRWAVGSVLSNHAAIKKHGALWGAVCFLVEAT